MRLLVLWIAAYLIQGFSGGWSLRTLDANSPPWRRDQVNHRSISYGSDAVETLCRMKDLGRLNSHLDRILVPRTVGSTNHKHVASYIERTLRPLGYLTERDEFTHFSASGSKTFSNIIATLDPSVPRRLTLACHYDSKDMQARYGFEFLGATDSAFPCSLLLDVAQSLAPYISNRQATNVSVQFIFFDGEEAFADWTSRDSLYGSRHLANLLEGRPYPSRESGTVELDRIDLLLLLDLLGSAGPTIPNYAKINDFDTYMTFVDIERQLRNIQTCLDTSFPNENIIFTERREQYVIEDDQLPFFMKGVPVMHMVPTPFPRVWHSKRDDRSALSDHAMTNLATIVRVFVSRYLGIRL